MLHNKGKKYLPSKRDFTADFGNKVITGKKLLLKTSEVNFIDDVPKYKELSAKRIWLEIRRNRDVMKYFPDFPPNRVNFTCIEFILSRYHSDNTYSMWLTP